MRKFLSVVSDNLWTIFMFIWAITSILDLGGIMFSVNSTDSKTSVSIERAADKEKPESTPKDSPQSSW